MSGSPIAVMPVGPIEFLRDIRPFATIVHDLGLDRVILPRGQVDQETSKVQGHPKGGHGHSQQ